ncbi:SET and MYND domain-containing protein 3 [Tupaia chinensis]|uniref:SET and MYND domain-containing protein 3 n=1 Tax=Tupaia chinensis TaxID=246437 RepID=L9JK62_TUPCH|nr:SET and MYND domain-containing protein 3 [Tupaia chinensis]
MCQTIISSNSERLPDINIYQLKVLDCAMDACINLGLLEEALFYGIRTMEPYRLLSVNVTFEYRNQQNLPVARYGGRTPMCDEDQHSPQPAFVGSSSHVLHRCY